MCAEAVIQSSDDDTDASRHLALGNTPLVGGEPLNSKVRGCFENKDKIADNFT